MKKKLLILFIAQLFAGSIIAQSVVISGKILTEKRPADFSLVAITNGNAKVIATSVLSRDGLFAFAFTPDYEGFYTVGTGAKDSDLQFPVYIKGGEHINIVIKDKNIAYEGELTTENRILAQWVALSEVVRNKSHYWQSDFFSTYKDFFPDIEALVAKNMAFIAGIKTNNPKFDALMKDFV
jgi:hypothetical protein